VVARTGGLEWHMKTAHGLALTQHAEAAEAATRAAVAIVPYMKKRGQQGGSCSSAAAATPPLSGVMPPSGAPAHEHPAGMPAPPSAVLEPADLLRAQHCPAALARLVAEGRVKPLGAGLDACRSGDLEALRQLVEVGAGDRASCWDPASPSACDSHGSGALLWCVRALGVPALSSRGRACKRRNASGVCDLPEPPPPIPTTITRGDLIGRGHGACCGVFLMPRCLRPRCTLPRTCRAAGGGHLDVCRYLVERCGVDPLSSANARLARRGYNGRTALHWAARNGHVDVLRWLVEECGTRGVVRGGVDVGTADGTTAFCWAAWQGQLEATQYLCNEAGCDPHSKNGYGCNAAMWAAQGGHIDVCRYLRAQGVSFDLINHAGQGCLHKAAQRGHVQVCEWLVGPEVALLRPSKPTAHLHCASNKTEGSTPSELARFGGHADLARWLEKVIPGA
jgi:hypothetical protein